MVQKRRGTAYLLVFLAFMALALGGLYMAFDQAAAPIADETAAQTSVVPQMRVIGGVEYPVNENGQTYGSSDSLHNMLDGLSSEQSNAMTEDELIALLPDLVYVQAWDGTYGYVTASDYYDAVAGFLKYADGKTPAEAVAGLDAFNARTWPMYAQDGVTVVGEFGGDISESNLFFTD